MGTFSSRGRQNMLGHLDQFLGEVTCSQVFPGVIPFAAAVDLTHQIETLREMVLARGRALGSMR